MRSAERRCGVSVSQGDGGRHFREGDFIEGEVGEWGGAGKSDVESRRRVWLV